MKYLIQDFDPSATLSGNIQTGLGNSCGSIKLKNESNIGLTLTFQDGSKEILSAWEENIFTLTHPSPNIGWAQRNIISGNSPISVVQGVAYTPEEKITGVYPAYLPRLTNVGNQLPVNIAFLTNTNNPEGTTVISITEQGSPSPNVTVGVDGSITVAAYENTAVIPLFQISPENVGLGFGSPVMLLGAAFNSVVQVLAGLWVKGSLLLNSGLVGKVNPGDAIDFSGNDIYIIPPTNAGNVWIGNRGVQGIQVNGSLQATYLLTPVYGNNGVINLYETLVYVNNQLSVAGAATFGASATFQGTVQCNALLYAASTFQVAGAATFGASATFQAAVSMQTTLAVTGASTLTGNVSCGGTLTVTSTSTFNGNVSISGTNTLTVGGASTLTGNVSCSGTLSVTSTSSFTGAATFSSTIAVTGASTLTGNVSCGGTLTVTSTSTFNGNVTISGTNTLSVGGTSTLTGNVSCSGTLSVTGTSTLTGNVSCSGTLTVTSTSTFNGNVSISGTNTLSVGGTSTLTGNVSCSGTLSVTGTSSLTGAVTLGAALNFLIGSITKMNIFNFTAAGVGTNNAHGLGVVPDICLCITTRNGGQPQAYAGWDSVNSDATYVKLYSSSAIPISGVAIAIKK